MSKITKIQWCDSTVNPVMGCKGCELFPKATTILSKINKAVKAVCSDCPDNHASELYTKEIEKAYRAIENPSKHHKNELTTTNLYHLRECFEKAVKKEYGKEAAEAARKAIEQAITCYASKLHLNKAHSLLSPERKPNKGYAPTFEEVTTFEGRVKTAAAMPDLLGRKSEKEPWMGTLARTIFVSDMGDAFSREADFDFLERDTMSAITSDSGKKHLWLWLTKQPHTMAKFAKQIGGFPQNVCAMTTMTSPNAANQKRLRDLKAVDAPVKGLSIEPLWEEIKPDQLDLEGIDWVIVGGESGAKKYARPFELEWARLLRDHCRDHDVAFFLKQMGSNPRDKGETVKMNDPHGGDWEAWSQDLRVREFPEAFHQFRKNELDKLDPESLPDRNKASAGKGKSQKLSPKLDTEERKDLKKLEAQIKRGATVFMKVGHALAEIKRRKLYREEYKTFQAYCEQKHGFTRQYGYLLADAARTHDTINPLLKKRGLEAVETERSLRALKVVKEDQKDEVIDIIAEEVEDRSKPIPFDAIKRAVDSIKEKATRTKTTAPENADQTDGPTGTGSVEEFSEAASSESKKGGTDSRSPVRQGFKGKVFPKSNTGPEDPLVKQLEEALKLARDGDKQGAYTKLKEIIAAHKEAA